MLNVSAAVARRAVAERARYHTERDDGTHVYLSTACRHDECDSCRKACKFCDAKCVCACHLIETDDND